MGIKKQGSIGLLIVFIIFIWPLAIWYGLTYSWGDGTYVDANARLVAELNELKREKLQKEVNELKVEKAKGGK